MMEFPTMTIIKSAKGLIAMAGLMGGLVLTSSPAFARRDVSPLPPAPTSQMMSASQMMMSCNHTMQGNGGATPPSAPSNKS